MAPQLSQPQRTFHLHPPEAADTVEVSVTASTAQGGILIADTAPGELLFLSLRPGGHGLNIWRTGRNGGHKVPDGVWEGGWRNSRPGREGGCGGGPGVCVWGFPHLRLCPAGLGLGSESWLCRDVKATCLIQGSFFSELWTGRRGTAPHSRQPRQHTVFLRSVALALNPSSFMLSVAADTPSQGPRGRSVSQGQGGPARTGAAQ